MEFLLCHCGPYFIFFLARSSGT